MRLGLEGGLLFPVLDPQWLVRCRLESPTALLPHNLLLDNLDHVFILKLVDEPATLRVVLAGEAPHEAVLELRDKGVVDLATEGLHGGAAAV